MNQHNQFWEFFNKTAAPELALREKTFRRIFQYLDLIDGPVIIVETGCARLKDHWTGDGQSTVMFDNYISFRDERSQVFSVDINPQNVSECKKLVSERTVVTNDDSVHFLTPLSRNLEINKQFILLWDLC